MVKSIEQINKNMRKVNPFLNFFVTTIIPRKAFGGINVIKIRPIFAQKYAIEEFCDDNRKTRYEINQRLIPVAINKNRKLCLE